MEKLLQFWALIAIPCFFMLFLAWKYKMGDRFLVRRTSIYFASIFLILPVADYLVYLFVSKNLAKIAFLTFFLLGTLVYFGLTVRATFMARRST